MAAIVESSIEISRRPEDVFSYVADRSHDPEWIQSVVSAHWQGDAPLAVGSKLQAIRRVGPRTVRYTEEMLELDPPRTWANRGYGGLPVSVIAKGRVEPLDAGRRSRLTVSTHSRGVGSADCWFRCLPAAWPDSCQETNTSSRNCWSRAHPKPQTKWLTQSCILGEVVPLAVGFGWGPP